MAGYQSLSHAVSFKSVQLFKEQVLGIGSYGKVYRAKCGELICAAKLIHETLFDPIAQQVVAPQREHTLPMRRFEQECQFLSAIKHPNVVQYLGIYQDPDTGLPVLLMELMDDSLTNFLESSTQPILYHIVVNICHDIALALSFLHSNDVIHRDLSSNNVLLIGDVRAKVTDFGMARLGDRNPRASHLTFTLCPGTDVFMPPEAVRDRPVYTEKIDCFSFGVITLQMLTRKFPKPGDRTKEVEITQPGIPSGTVAEIRVPEIERRQNHISRVDPNHALLRVTLECLKDRDTERPSAKQLCERVAAVKESQDYSESVRAAKGRNTNEQGGRREREIELTSLRQRHAESLRQKDEVIAACQGEMEQLRQKHAEAMATSQQQLGRKQSEIEQLGREKDQVYEESERMLMKLRQQYAEGMTTSRRQIRQKENAIEQLRKEKERVSQQLEESEKVVAHFQRRIIEFEQLRPATDTTSSSSSRRRERIKMTWKEGRKAPLETRGSYNAVADDTNVYVRTGNRLFYAYTTGTSTWSQLPNSPTDNCPSVIVNNLLTVVGGDCFGAVTNQLFSLVSEGRGRIWKEVFPAMPTKRWGSVALCTTTALIVVGGVARGVNMSTVEIMDTETLQWSTAVGLPQPLLYAPGAVCGDHIHILSLGRRSKSMYTCSVSALIQSCRSRPTHTTGVWNTVAAPPVTLTTCVSTHGRLLAIGGMDSNNKLTAAVYMYDSTAVSWEIISHMTTPRYNCYAAVLSNNKLMVGGGGTENGKTDSVEIATVE